MTITVTLTFETLPQADGITALHRVEKLFHGFAIGYPRTTSSTTARLVACDVGGRTVELPLSARPEADR